MSPASWQPPPEAKPKTQYGFEFHLHSIEQARAANNTSQLQEISTDVSM